MIVNFKTHFTLSSQPDSLQSVPSHTRISSIHPMLKRNLPWILVSLNRGSRLTGRHNVVLPPTKPSVTPCHSLSIYRCCKLALYSRPELLNSSYTQYPLPLQPLSYCLSLYAHTHTYIAMYFHIYLFVYTVGLHSTSHSFSLSFILLSICAY